jgi:hypothetical protein
MAEMVDRVARAIAEKHGLVWTGQAVFDDLARVTIAAMREPTEAMVAAGEASSGIETFDPIEDFDPREPWRAMIGAALGEPR